MSNTTTNWLDDLLPLPRPEYAKQTEALLTDLLWRSEGSSLSSGPTKPYFDYLSDLRQEMPVHGGLDPDRLVPKRRHGGSARQCETLPIAHGVNLAALVHAGTGMASPTEAALASCMAPRARGDKADACVPLHPAAVCLQTLHGLVNKESPANLANAIETIGWLGGAPARGQVAASFLQPFSAGRAQPGDGLAGFLDSLFPQIAQHVWASLPSHVQSASIAAWPPTWPDLSPVFPAPTNPAALAGYPRTPFTWFWNNWSKLCDPQRGWYDLLPTRRFVDWCLCLLRTGLAFSYLWEAEFFCRLHERIIERARPAGTPNRLRSMFIEGAPLAVFEPAFVPTAQKNAWPSISQLLARGYEARKRFHDLLEDSPSQLTHQALPDAIEAWVQGLSQADLLRAAAPLEPQPRTANNQKEFVRYLLLARTSDDDVVDQADFYYLARTNSRRHVWCHPGPEWLVVVTSLLCDKPGGQATLGTLLNDLAALGLRVDRSVLIALLEEAGLSTDSPDADDALVIRSGF